MGPSENLGVEALRDDIKALSAEIAQLATYLLGPARQQDTHPSPSPPSTPSRLSKLTNTLRVARQRSLKRRGKYDRLDSKGDKSADHAPLLERRGSGDSDATLVDQPLNDHPSVDKHIGDGMGTKDSRGRLMGAGKLLALLAPHVSELQRIGSRLNSRTEGSGRAGDDSTCSMFRDVCAQLQKLLHQLQGTSTTSTSFNPFGLDSHDLEMRDLMISALIKKVEIEVDRVSMLPSISCSVFGSSSTSSSTSTLANVGKDQISLGQAACRNSIPFVVHSAGLLAPPATHGGRRGSQARPIGHTTPYGSGDQASQMDRLPVKENHQGFSEFMTHSQTSSGWAKNLVRLGSYQASLLFSNSPVAVRRLGSEGGKA